MILKELRNLENPSLKVITRKMWDIQFQEVFWVVVMWWMVGVYWRRRIGGGETFYEPFVLEMSGFDVV